MILRSALVGAAAVVLAAGWVPAGAADASAWSIGHGGAMRLLAADPVDAAHRRVGVEIRLEEGWKTYWRVPGDAGVPPVFDWSGSENIRSVRVKFPAPLVFVDGGGTSIGYKDDVVFPVHVVVEDSGRPASVRLVLDYAVCKEICVPVRGEASLVVGADRPGIEVASLVAAHEARVPRPTTVGAAGPLAIAIVHAPTSAAPAEMLVDVSAPDSAELFAEGPAAWFLPVPEAVAGAPAGHRRFRVSLDGVPKSEPKHGTTVTLTLVAGDEAIEAPFTIP